MFDSIGVFTLLGVNLFAGYFDQCRSVVFFDRVRVIFMIRVFYF